MDKFPTLTEMGIKNAHEISHYTLRPDGKDHDVLKIFYKRQKGSLLPHRKSFRFGRSAKMISDRQAEDGTTETFEISPFLTKAMDELDTIVKQRHKEKDLTELMLKRVEQLEKDVLASTSEIRSILKNLKEN